MKLTLSLGMIYGFDQEPIAKNVDQFIIYGLYLGFLNLMIQTKYAEEFFRENFIFNGNYNPISVLFFFFFLFLITELLGNELIGYVILVSGALPFDSE